MSNWKDIFDGLYSVSDDGQIRANQRTINTKTGPRVYRERILTQEVTRDGYARVTLSNANHKQRYFVHRLVAEAFLPNPQNLPVINHKDENPLNNNICNLEWCTTEYNNTYNDRHKKIGDKEGTTILVYKDDNFIESFPSITKFAQQYNIPLTTAWRHIKNKQTIMGYTVVKEENINENIKG